MSKAEELAQAYADAVSTHRLESLYGTSKSYTLEKAQERDEAHAALTAELRRLAALEKAIMDAAPVAVALRFGTDERICLSTVFDTKDEAQDYANSTANGAHLVSLYTLNGIKP